MREKKISAAAGSSMKTKAVSSAAALPRPKDKRGGRELLIADTPDEFARSVLNYLEDQRGAGCRSESMGKAARHFVAGAFTWDRILPRLDEVYDTLHHTPGMSQLS